MCDRAGEKGGVAGHDEDDIILQSVINIYLQQVVCCVHLRGLRLTEITPGAQHTLPVDITPRPPLSQTVCMCLFVF